MCCVWELRLPGDEVTELDTPDGSWCRVVAVEPGTGTVAVEVATALHVVVAVGSWKTGAVLHWV